MRAILLSFALGAIGCGGDVQEHGTAAANDAGIGGAGGVAGAAGEAGTAGTAGTAGVAGAAGGTEVWPSDATELQAYSGGGGEAPPPPQGSECAMGERRFHVIVSSRQFDWSVCLSNPPYTDPYKFDSGQRPLTEAEYGQIDTAMKGVTISTGSSCGADKPMMTLTVITLGGSHEFTDSFYECMGGGKTYVDNIDAVFSAFSNLVK
jgi:hypothetical protein